MGYFVIQDFRLGLDRRKHILTLPPGALYDAKNCVINRGGEPEAAKAFVKKFTLPAGKTFGMQAAGGQLYTFGSVASPGVPGDVIYQRLQHPSGAAMTELVWAKTVKGKPYAIAAFTGGLIASFFNGALMSDWASGAVGGTMATNADIAAHFATIINTDPDFSATSAGGVTTITGPAGAPFTLVTQAINGGAVDDQFAAASLIQAAIAGTGETLAHGSLTIAGAVAGNTVTSVKVNTIEVLGATVTKLAGWTDAQYASAIAAQINAYASTPEYTASTAGAVVNIFAAPGTGAAPNGWVVARTITGVAGTVVAANMAGGVAAVGGTPQISSVTFGGTFEAGDIFSIILNDKTFGGTSGAAGEQATVALPHKGRTYAVAGPNLFGSALGDATEWNGGIGSFVIDMSEENTGSERLTALGIFQGRLAVFARSTVQIMLVDSDPANIEQAQVLENIGTMAPKSVVAFGDEDLFFLADTGVRSLRVRVNSQNAVTSDLGSPIDPIITAAIQAAGGSATKAVGVIEPIDGRYLLQLGTDTYAFSYFPDAKVSAWTICQSGLSFTNFSTLDQRLYARAGDVIYLLGGDGNNAYAAQAMEVALPFMSAHQLATLKHFTGVTVATEGVFDISMGTDPKNPDVREPIAKVTDTTEHRHIEINGEDTVAISLRFVGKPGEYGKVACAIVHFEPLGEA